MAKVLSTDALKSARNVLSPDVWQFIDPRRFARSTICESAMHSAVAHVKNHGDITVVNPWLEAFANTEFFEAAVEYFTHNAGLCITCHSGVIRIQKGNFPTPEYAHFQDVLARSKGRKLEDIFGRGAKLKSKIAHSYLDAMDSGNILPGSFGNGKR